MLRIPSLRQPDDAACLPTCVAAVLAFLGREVDLDQIRRWCGTTKLGSDVDRAIQGLGDAGIDAELVQCETLGDLEDLLLESRPPIAVMAEGGSWSVVVCGIDAECVTVMDPRTGGYARIARSEFLDAWSALAGETLLVAGHSASGASPA